MKSGNSSSKTNYSPVRQMNHPRTSQYLQDEFPPIELQRQQQQYQNNQLQRQHSNGQHQEQQQQPQHHHHDQEFDLDQLNEQSPTPEEVYICDCCCISKELTPSIKFMSTFKSLFFLFNFLVFAFGLANFGMGLWFRIDPKVYEIHKYIETQNFTIAGWIMLFGGFLACLLASVGFIAAARQAASLLVFYFGTMIVLTLAFVGTIVLLTVYGLGLSLENFLIKEIYEQMRRRTMNTEIESFRMDDAIQFLDFIQVKMRCCGAADFRDYSKLGMVVPTSCLTIDKNYVVAPGCGHALRQLFDLRAGLGAGFTSGSIIVQLMSIITSALMFCSIYHWRANPRPATPVGSTGVAGARISQNFREFESPVASASHHSNLFNQRPRSRTPIVI